MTAASRSQRRQAPSRHRGLGLGPWRCRRITTSGLRLTAASARWSTRRTVRPGGVSPPSSLHLLPPPSSSFHPHTHTYTHSQKLIHYYLSHPDFITLCQNAACQQELGFPNQTPTIPRAVYTFVKEVCDLTAAQQNQYAT